ncbi:MAG: tetratricopeptide repeat protein [Planctomycetota bacterium]
MKTLPILVLAFCLLLSCGGIGTTEATDGNKSKTAYDFYLSGNSLYRKGEYDEAVTAFRKSIALNVDYFFARINLGAALAKTREYKKAAQEFTFCIEKKWGCEYDRFAFYHNRALAAHAAGDSPLALNDRAALKNLDPVRADKLKDSADYILMDAAFMEAPSISLWTQPSWRPEIGQAETICLRGTANRSWQARQLFTRSATSRVMRRNSMP